MGQIGVRKSRRRRGMRWANQAAREITPRDYSLSCFEWHLSSLPDACFRFARVERWRPWRIKSRPSWSRIVEHTQSHCCTCIKLVYESIFTPIASFCQSDVPPRRLFAVQKSLSVQVHPHDRTHHEQLVVYTCQPRCRQQGERS